MMIDSNAEQMKKRHVCDDGNNKQKTNLLMITVGAFGDVMLKVATEPRAVGLLHDLQLRRRPGADHLRGGSQVGDVAVEGLVQYRRVAAHGVQHPQQHRLLHKEPAPPSREVISGANTVLCYASSFFEKGYYTMLCCLCDLSFCMIFAGSFINHFAVCMPCGSR